ncbi:ABC-F family ATP-binding cassette domain-containing protein [Anaerostipes faecalis]|uniref:ABC-F family ATP-binding cassette domain-containing protein n=1 Tax=Anaerostipes faecalis TaxID=2738446 RepID=UPI001C1DD392|nr:ABC-F family ATP-binding cassette domain-containing protein [Anaerostipes faecalis]
MNILNIEHISKIYGEKVIFDDVSCGIHQGDKIGIIGVNGTGKTTLLKIITGMEEPDLGQVICGNGISVAYLPQNPEFPKELTILEYVMEGKEHQDWKTESDAKSILTRLGIYDFESSTKYLSGGQKKRVALARTLVDPAEVLVLDEPTNHLDNDMVLWLEDYLNQFRGVLIMVTHDRYFLDRVTNKIVEIDKGKLYEYNANYSGFLELKVQREEMEQATERKRQSLLRVEMEWMKQGIKARGTRQRARTERFEALKNAAGPEIQQKVEMDSVSSRLGKKTIEIEHVSKGYDDKQLIQDFSYIILRDDRLGIIGPNGCGKSTLMKMIMGIVSPDEGQIIIGDTVKIGYFAQENEEMEEDKRVIDYIRDVADYIETARGKASASQMLERFLFPPALQYTPLNKLSGGEKRRLYLLRVLMEAPNVLILDEPTNDLDIATLTILEDYLDTFQGIVITVSHDRYFLDRIVNRIFAFESGGRLVQYEGGYTDYLEKTKDKFKQIQTKKEPKDNKGTKFQKTHQKKLKFTFKEQKEFETIDEDIEKLETKIEQLDEEIMKNATNSGRLSELTVEKEETEAQLNEKMDRWVYLNDLAERIENQNL